MMLLPEDNQTSSPAYEYAWECALILTSVIVSVWMTDNAISLTATSFPPLEQLISTGLSAVLAVLLWWNVLCIFLLRICTVGLLPVRLTRSLLLLLQRWGSRHTRQIAARHLVRSTALAAIASSFVVAGAHATPETSHSNAQADTSVSTQVPLTASLPSPLFPVQKTSEAHQSLPNPSIFLTNADVAHPQPTETTSGFLPTPRSDVTEILREQNLTPDKKENRVTVKSGDCLWSIAAKQLPDSDDSAIASLVDRIYDSNRDVIGPNPHVIHPGMTIYIPSSVQESS